MKTYNKAPLPFQGQKRQFLKSFKEVLKGYSTTLANPIFVDLFGGSGLLSHTTKALYPNSQVVYNDYDNYHVRLKNVDKTNALLADLRNIVIDYKRECKIGDQHKQAIITRILQEKGYVDYITLSSSLLFSMNYVQSIEGLQAQTFYNNIISANYSAEGYLDGLEVVSMDYKALFDIYKDVPNVVFFLDPPYLTTDATSYKSGQYWSLADYLNILNMLKDANYIYFTSNKSSIVELCEWLNDYVDGSHFFKGATIHYINMCPTNSSRYKDIMLSKNKC